MNDDAAEQPSALSDDGGEAPLSNPLRRIPVAGCLGIACVLALPVLLYLPIETWQVPFWFVLLVPLVAFGLAALGGWLLAHVPASGSERTRDPLHPLTRTGTPPVLEEPADWRNRAGVVIVVALLLAGGAGFLVASFAADRARGLLVGTAISATAGALLLLYGAGLISRRFPAPALSWVRQPIQRGYTRVGAPVALTGLALLVWAFWAAEYTGYGWGAAGLALLLLVGVLLLPLMRRLPVSVQTRGGTRSHRAANGSPNGPTPARGADDD